MNTNEFIKIGYCDMNILSYIPHGIDSYCLLICARKKICDKLTSMQYYADEFDGNTKFNRILYPLYNYFGQIIDSCYLYFDFENELLYVNNRKYKVESDYKYIYRFYKTKIKAMHGINGLYEFILDNMNTDSALNISIIRTLNKAQ